MKIRQAMILAAGLGTRMEHLTVDVPKPMIEVNGMSLIERHLHYLFAHNIKKIVINLHYKAEMLQEFICNLAISKKLDIYFSYEDVLLGTAGGVKKALKFLGHDDFFVVNSDVILVDSYPNNSALVQLDEHWNQSNMALLILIINKLKALGYYGNGDFDKTIDGQLSFQGDIREFIHAGISILNYRIFDQSNIDEKLEFLPIYKNLSNNGQLCGYEYEGKWFHIGSLKAYQEHHSL